MLKRNLLLFLSGSVPVGTMTGWYAALKYDFNTAVTAAMIFALMAGLVVYFLLGYLHVRAVRNVGAGGPSDILDLHHLREVLIHLPFHHAYELCLASLEQINGCHIREQNRSEGVIEAETSINWKTWGDTIQMKLIRQGSDLSLVRIWSRPTFRTTIVDYGKNLENVRKIERFLTGVSSS